MEEDVKSLAEELLELFNDKGLKHLVPHVDVIAAFVQQSCWLDQVTWEAGQEAWDRAEAAYGISDDDEDVEVEE